MRIARSHQLAAIFENLHMADPGNLAKRGILLGPAIHDGAQFLMTHSRNCQIVPRRKTHDAADSRFGLRGEQTSLVKLRSFTSGQQRRIIVVENARSRVLRCLRSTGTAIPWAQITARIERACRRNLRLLDFSQPRPLRAMRGHQNPLAQQRIETLVRDSM